MSDTVYYAIGDVHGEIGKLETLLNHIREDARMFAAAYKIVFLGDLIDRGPDSRAVVAHAMSAERAGDAIVLKGNHEELMLHAYANRDSISIYHWAENGGDETIAAYKAANGEADDWRDAVDADHLHFLRSLKVTHHDEARGLVFVHAGIDPKVFPLCTDELRMWTRSEKFYDHRRWPERPELDGIMVIHGHTPTSDFAPDLNPRRINVDTGACFGGPLTCAVLAPNERPRFLVSRS